jgi:hypothetical protein
MLKVLKRSDYGLLYAVCSSVSRKVWEYPREYPMSLIFFKMLRHATRISRLTPILRARVASPPLTRRLVVRAPLPTRQLSLLACPQVSTLVRHLHATHLDFLMLGSEEDDGRFLLFILMT